MYSWNLIVLVLGAEDFDLEDFFLWLFLSLPGAGCCVCCNRDRVEEEEEEGGDEIEERGEREEVVEPEENKLTIKSINYSLFLRGVTVVE